MIDKKRRIVVCVSVIIIACLVGFIQIRKTNKSVNSTTAIESHNRIPDDYLKKGYCYGAETNNAIYYFSYGTDEERLRLINNFICGASS